MKISIETVGDAESYPCYATSGAAGADLRANINTPLSVLPGGTVMVPTGISIAIPQGYEGQVRPRSGLAFKHGVTVLNSPGTIDSDYRGEIQILLINHGDKIFVINNKDRIAQLIIAPVIQAEFIPAEKLDKTKRSDGGFGSTGRG